MQIYDCFLDTTFLNNYEAIQQQKWENYQYILWAMEKLYMDVKKYRDVNPIPRVHSINGEKMTVAEVKKLYCVLIEILMELYSRSRSMEVIY
jgi:hypothetical protein